MAVISQAKLPSDEHHWTLVMMSQHWFMQWLGAVMHKPSTEPMLIMIPAAICRH